jgi:hypothetical protein
MKILKSLAITAILDLWSFPALAIPIYAIKSDGDMLFYKHTGSDDGSPTWPIQQGKRILSIRQP